MHHYFGIAKISTPTKFVAPAGAIVCAYRGVSRAPTTSTAGFDADPKTFIVVSAWNQGVMWEQVAQHLDVLSWHAIKTVGLNPTKIMTERSVLRRLRQSRIGKPGIVIAANPGFVDGRHQIKFCPFLRNISGIRSKLLALFADLITEEQDYDDTDIVATDRNPNSGMRAALNAKAARTKLKNRQNRAAGLALQEGYVAAATAS